MSERDEQQREADEERKADAGMLDRISGNVVRAVQPRRPLSRIAQDVADHLVSTHGHAESDLMIRELRSLQCDAQERELGLDAARAELRQQAWDSAPGCIVERFSFLPEGWMRADARELAALRVRTPADALRLSIHRELNTARRCLGNLLARIHGDGGQHANAVGFEAATEEADGIICELRRERDEARAEAAELREWKSATLDGFAVAARSEPMRCDAPDGTELVVVRESLWRTGVDAVSEAETRLWPLIAGAYKAAIRAAWMSGPTESESSDALHSALADRHSTPDRPFPSKGVFDGVRFGE